MYSVLCHKQTSGFQIYVNKYIQLACHGMTVGTFLVNTVSQSKLHVHHICFILLPTAFSTCSKWELLNKQNIVCPEG